MKQKPYLHLNVYLCIHPLTYIIETFQLVGTVRLPFCSQYCITLVFFGRHSWCTVLLRPHPFNLLMAGVIKKQRGRKTALSSYYACISRNLLLMSSGVDTHTHTPTFVDEMISRNQVHAGCRHVRATGPCTWFKK